MEIDELRELASSRVRAGQLPPQRPGRFFGGPGNGERCDVCHGRIGPASVAIEVDRVDESTLTFHATCFRAYNDSIARRA